MVVIDGVVSTSDQLNRMNPVDIANISVLKDAASSAIYGSRAAFGVILVTTRMVAMKNLPSIITIILYYVPIPACRKL